MRRLTLISFALSIGLALPAIGRAQSPAETSPTAAPAGDDQTKPAAPSTGQGKPVTAPPTATPQTTAAPTVEVPHSLFDQTWRQFQFGARLTNIDGDPARFQRYQDVRDGVLFTDARYANEAPEGDWQFRAAADNVGYVVEG